MLVWCGLQTAAVASTTGTASVDDTSAPCQLSCALCAAELSDVSIALLMQLSDAKLMYDRCVTEFRLLDALQCPAVLTAVSPS